ncbi:MAG: hypothetical protein AAFR79_07575 [Pseudomonadota bacterium]
MKALTLLLDGAMPRANIRMPIGEWIRVARERRALAKLDHRALIDMGIDPTAARIESERPFWDLPRTR